MGCGPSLTPEEQERMKYSKKIDMDLKKHQKDYGKEIKILLLGPGGSGKLYIKKLKN